MRFHIEHRVFLNGGRTVVFVAALPKRQDYRLRAEGHGAVWEFEDPFRFGPVLGEMDEERLSGLQDYYLKEGIITQKTAVKDLYTNEFIK